MNLQCNRSRNFSFANGVKICQFKEKDSKINSYPLCSYNFSVDDDINNIDDILDIYKNLMEKHDINNHF